MSNQQQGDDKNSMQILWIIGGLFFVGAAIWWGFSEQIKYAFIKIRLVELYLIKSVTMLIPIDSIRMEVNQAVDVAKYATPAGLSVEAANYLSHVVGKYLRFPIVIALGVFAYFVYTKNIKMRYKKRYDMNKLAEQECIEWPQIKPVLGLDLVNQDLNSGPWAMASSPVAFCKKHKIITIIPHPPKTLSEGPHFEIEMDEMRAERIFTAQLGRLWHDPFKIPIHRRAIFAAFIARGCRDTKSAQALMLQISRSCDAKNPGVLDFTGTDELVKKHYNNDDVQEICSLHAYEFTLFTALLLFAREDGVFASADFIWLKPIDRTFWYVLNNVGRQTPSVEAAGVHAHFLAEKALRRPLTVPMISEAVKALRAALDEIKYVPDQKERQELLKNM